MYPTHAAVLDVVTNLESIMTANELMEEVRAVVESWLFAQSNELHKDDWKQVNADSRLRACCRTVWNQAR
jgi:hypothetical protein